MEVSMKLSYLVKRPPGTSAPSAPDRCDDRDLHVAAAAGVLSALGLTERNVAVAWWLALVASAS
jgi:hypothetical protein